MNILPLIKDGAKDSLIVTSQGGAQAVSPLSAFVDKNKGFTAVLDLSNPAGAFWLPLVQTGVINLTVGGQSVIGGADRASITANGSAINLDSAYTWRSRGVAIDTTNGKINVIYFVKVGPTEIDYTNVTY